MAHPLTWQIATVTALKPETARVKTITLALALWTPHRAGQHYDVRLTALPCIRAATTVVVIESTPSTRWAALPSRCSIASPFPSTLGSV